MATSQSPSASFNLEKGLFACFGKCSWKGTLANLEKRLGNPNKVDGDQLDFFDTDEKATELPSEKQIIQWHERLLGIHRLVQFLRQERGLFDQTINDFQIGFDGLRFTIPIRDLDKVLVNVRRYDPHAKRSGDKMLSLAGHGEARIFCPWIVSDSLTVVICEGEMDAIIAQQYGFSAVSPTGGAGTWKPEWSILFREKHVAIIYDNDPAGLRGAQKVANSLYIAKARSIRIVKLEDLVKGGDVTDWFVGMGFNAEQLRDRINRTKKFNLSRVAREQPESGVPVSLKNSMAGDLTSRAVEFVATIAGKQNPPYVVPRKVSYSCTQSKGDICSICPMAVWGGKRVEEIATHDPIMAEFFDAKKPARKKTLKEFIGAKCIDQLTIEEVESWSAEELVVKNSVEERTEDADDQTQRRIYAVGAHATPVNITARILGSQLADPRDGRGLFQAWSIEPVKTNIETFELTPELREELRIFQPEGEQTPLQKMGEIARDLAANVTQIYGRTDLHLAYDLVWHSAMDFQFQGKKVGKGWLEALVVGDTRTGKTEAAERLADHYRAGTVTSCEGATFAGLVGGAQQLASKWMVTWGVIPLNDRRLVVLDEMTGLRDRNVIENMSSIRSSGKAQISKIAAAETNARTRLIWLTNPPEAMRLSEIHGGGGLAAIPKLISNPEDVARFDFALSAASEDVSTELINTNEHEKVPHRFTSELCAALVMWVWSRKVDQVSILAPVQQRIITQAKALGARYVPEPPLIQSENIRVKLTRLSVAIAARLFSTNEDGSKIIVRSEHVDAAVTFLDWIYDRPFFGYKSRSAKELKAQERSRQNKEKVREYLLHHQHDILATLQMVDSKFKTRDFSDFAGLSQEAARAATSTLRQLGMVSARDKGYLKMQPALIELLSELEEA
jgi:DNA primase